MEAGHIGFEKRIFSGLPQVTEVLALPPSARWALFEEGVPSFFFYRIYSAGPALSVVHPAGRPPVVRFGVDSNRMMGVDTASGNVVHIRAGAQEVVTFVNTTLGDFCATARALADQFPYGASLDGFEGTEEATAERMREIIRSIDAEAMLPGAYWPDYADEIDGLWYGLDEIMEWYQRKSSRPPSMDD